MQNFYKIITIISFKMTANALDSLMDDLGRADLVLLGENHGFLPEYKNAFEIEQYLIGRAFEERKRFVFALGYADYRIEENKLDIRGKEAYLKRLFQQQEHDYNRLMRPIITALKIANARLEFAGNYDGLDGENSRTMGQYLASIVRLDEITLGYFGHKHLGSVGFHGTIQTFIPEEINCLTILQARDDGPIIEKLKKTHPKCPDYVLRPFAHRLIRR